MEQLATAEDLDLGASSWVEMTQDRIDRFAEASGDNQWIHVDPKRATDGPFGTTIAHGYLTLALLIPMMEELLEIPDRGMAINYGLDRVRLTAPVPVDSRVRARARLLDAEQRGDGIRYRVEATVEVEGKDRPALVATAHYLAYPHDAS